MAVLCSRYPMAMGTLADLEDQEPIPGKESPIKIHLKVQAAHFISTHKLKCRRAGL